MKLKAFTLVELLTSIAVITIIITFGFQVFQLAVRTSARSQQFIAAETLARDMLEITEAKRNENWNSLEPGTFHFEDQTVGTETVKEFVAGDGTSGIFAYNVVIAEVERDIDGDVVESGGTVDEDVMKATANVSWTFMDKSETVTVSRYFTNWRRF